MNRLKQPAGLLKGASLLFLMLGWTSVTQAQPAAAESPAQAPPPAGPQIVSVSAYGAYYSHGLPETVLQPGAANLPFDIGGGGSIVFNWSKFTERTTFSVNYTPSYTGQVRYSSLNTLNHVFSFNVSRKITPRLSLGFTTAANYSGLQEALFASTALSNVSAVPSTFGQLSAALLSGSSANQQLDVVLTNSPLVESPLANLLYGQRVLSTSAQSTVSYSFSPRLSATFSGGGSRTQYISTDQTSSAGNAAILSNTMGATGTASLNYSFSAVTQIGGTVSTNWISSSFESNVTTTSIATFGRTLGRQWLVQLHGGVGFTEVLRQTSFAVPTKPLPAFGGSLGFKTGRSTVIGSFDHAVSDTYGLGSSSTSTSSLSWRWRRPGSRWTLQSSLSWQHLQDSVLTNTSGWRATAGVTRGFGMHLAMQWQYTYLRYSGGLDGASYGLAESAARVSLVWTPRPTLQ